MPIYYIYATVTRYRYAMGSSYQESVMRKSWAAGAIAGDWLYNIGASLKFWDWARGAPDYLPHSQRMVYGAVGALVFLAGACRLAHPECRWRRSVDWQQWLPVTHPGRETVVRSRGSTHYGRDSGR